MSISGRCLVRWRAILFTILLRIFNAHERGGLGMTGLEAQSRSGPFLNESMVLFCNAI